MKTLAVLSLGCCLLGGPPAHGARVDFAKMTCKEFFDAHKADANLLLAWLSGYYREDDDPPVFDTDELKADTKKLTEYCTAHPNDTVTKAADAAFAD